MIRGSQAKTATKYVLLVGLALILGLTGRAFSQQAAQTRGQGGGQAAAAAKPAPGKGAHPSLFFSEPWHQDMKEQHPLSQANVSNPNLELKFYGSGKQMEITGADDGGEDNPVRIFMGTCVNPCGAMFRDKNNYVDLSGLARIKWLTRVSGFHKLRPMVKLADGTVLVGDHAEGEISDYYETMYAVADIHWIKVDPDKLLAHGDFLNSVDLSLVDEIGFVDMMPGSGHGQGGFSSMSRMAVYGKPVPRSSVQSRASSGN